MADPALKAGFARDVALLRSVGMKPIVVHGGGWRIDALMRQMGMESRRHRGLRVTDERTLTVVEMALDELNQELTGLINTQGGRAVGLNGQDGRFIHARQMTLPPVDPGIAEPELGVVEGGMRPRVTAALRAVREGVRSVHIIDGGVPSALLLEVLTAEGVGTAVRADTGPHFLDDSRGYLLAE